MAPTPARTHAAELAHRLTERLREQGTPERAAGAKAYLKSDLDFLGVTVPALRRELRRLLAEQPPLDRAEALALAEALWDEGPFESKAAAAELLSLRTSILGFADLSLVERLLRDSHTWALVDALAPSVAGPVLDRMDPAHPDRRALLERWATDPDFWIRRAALLVHLLPLRRGGGDFPTFARHADAMLEEKELFIRKAIGWVLRDTSKMRPELVARWLLPRAGRASGVTVREAVKYLGEGEREAILAGYQGRRAAGRPPR